MQRPTFHPTMSSAMQKAIIVSMQQVSTTSSHSTNSDKVLRLRNDSLFFASTTMKLSHWAFKAAKRVGVCMVSQGKAKHGIPGQSTIWGSLGSDGSFSAASSACAGGRILLEGEWSAQGRREE
jgi:hypothetical protein